MNNYLIFAIVGIYVVYLCVCVLIVNLKEPNKEKELYETTIKENTHSAYREYLRKFPNSKYNDDIKQKYDVKCWEMVLEQPSLKRYKWYVYLHPNGQYKNQVKKMIEELESTYT